MRGVLRFFGRRRVQLVQASAAGALYCAAFCGYDQYYLAWICLVPLLWAQDDASLGLRGTTALAWTTGCVAHLGAYTWIVHMLRAFAFLPLPFAVLGWALLCVAQSSLFAGAFALSHYLTRRAGTALACALPASWVVAEWTWPALFPSYFANSQYLFPAFVQSLDLWGPLGISCLLVLVNVIAYQALGALTRRGRRAPRWGALALGVLLAGNFLYGYGRTADLDDTVAHAERRIAVGLVQANMGIYEKTDHPQEGLRRHRDQSLELEAQGAQLIVWPESAYYYPVYDQAHNVQQAVLGPLRTPLLFGGLRVSQTATGRRLYNSAFLADAHGDLLGHYDKTDLLMFGEYLPLGERWPQLYSLLPQASHLSFGTHNQPLTLDGVRYGVLVCYEDILPAIARRSAAAGAEVLVNLTNDAWYGDSNEPRIHLALGSFRAIEQRRYLIRATNTGISAIIDPLGHIAHETPIYTRANVVGEVAPLRERTVYARLGDWPGWAASLACLGWARRRWLPLPLRLWQRLRGGGPLPARSGRGRRRRHRLPA